MPKSNLPTLESLDTLTVSEIAALPGGILYDLQEQLEAAKKTLDKRKAVFFAAEEARYGESARQQLSTRDGAAKESGTVHVLDDDQVVDVEYKKKVEWHQGGLSLLWAHIAGSGEDPHVYMKRELSVQENVWKNWPESVRKEFAAARTVKTSKPSYRIGPAKKETGK